ncbi:MAG: S9 family peptidase [Gemmatimonadota bacterium]
MTAPIARIEPVVFTDHGVLRVDPYYWLRERENPEVLEYLKAENAYCDERLAGTLSLQKTLYGEITGRIQETDQSAPYAYGEYLYSTRLESGLDYPIHVRQLADGPEEVILDVNKFAEEHSYVEAAFQPSGIAPGQRLLAVPVDTTGRRIYTILLRDLDSGNYLEERIRGATSNLAWANDGRTLFYARRDPVTLREHQIYRHVLGADPAADELVYEEHDEAYTCWVFKTRSQGFLMIGSHQTVATEYRFLPADTPQGEFQLFLERQRNHEYHLDHAGSHFYVRTNLDAPDFRLARTSCEPSEPAQWEEVIPARPGVVLEQVELFDSFCAVLERAEARSSIRLLNHTNGSETGVTFDWPTYCLRLGDNFEFEASSLRYELSSPVEPLCVFDVDLLSGSSELRKRDPVPGGFESSNYRCERVWAPARDGTRIPVSLAYRPDLAAGGELPLKERPILVYGYGSYGISVEPVFEAARLSLLDRGFVHAIVHVRGGGELGRAWYEGAKLMTKKNTFNDFIDATDYLVAQGYASPERTSAMGRSAGGLLMGAVMNERPELFKAVVAGVPFVDVVTTMLDDRIPLTTGEYDEWGDPADRELFEYMLSYSPYDNVDPVAHPHVLVTTALHDSQVQYWEPAKWVARLRATSNGSGEILLRTDMKAGHGGASGRYKRYLDIALEYAFLVAHVYPPGGVV